MLLLLLLSRFSHVRLCATPWTVAYQGAAVTTVLPTPVSVPATKQPDGNLLICSLTDLVSLDH